MQNFLVEIMLPVHQGHINAILLYMRKPNFLVVVWGWWVGDAEVKLQEQTTAFVILSDLGYSEIMKFRIYLTNVHNLDGH